MINSIFPTNSNGNRCSARLARKAKIDYSVFDSESDYESDSDYDSDSETVSPSVEDKQTNQIIQKTEVIVTNISNGNTDGVFWTKKNQQELDRVARIMSELPSALPKPSEQVKPTVEQAAQTELSTLRKAIAKMGQAMDGSSNLDTAIKTFTILLTHPEIASTSVKMRNASKSKIEELRKQACISQVQETLNSMFYNVANINQAIKVVPKNNTLRNSLFHMRMEKHIEEMNKEIMAYSEQVKKEIELHTLMDHVEYMLKNISNRVDYVA